MKHTIFLLLIILLSSCHSESELVVDKKMYPSDHLYAQRSFPYGQVDSKAYAAAVATLQNSKNSQRSFDQAWLEKGPTNLSGRISDLEMPIDDDKTIFAGTASGGIFRSQDLGETWTPIFDEAAALSIGDIAIDRTDTEVMYVGTGEANAGGGSIAYDGLGVYKSTDGGDTWTAKGLTQVGSIGRVVIDPDDNNIALVGAMGSLFANNSDRGVYRTQDGGDNWEQVLFISDSTGVIDLAIDPRDGNIIYAATWERIRRPHKRQYGGATCGIYKSTDGGDSWSELTNGLPSLAEDKGRIGLSISESDPDILYIIYADQVGRLTNVYKTIDAGAQWTALSQNGIENISSFWWWFGRINVNPIDPDDIFLSCITMHRSIDGGQNWTDVFIDAHVDHHAMFLHPENEAIILNGNDGGVNLADSLDAVSSTFLSGVSNFQFYTCEINPQNPQEIWGGSQDNGISKTSGAADDWEILFGRDGFRVLVNPDDPQQVYAESQYGDIIYSTDGGKNFVPGIFGIDERRNWNCPLVLDPNDSQILYTGGQSLFRSTDGARSWQKVSTSLVKEDNPVGNIGFGTLTAIAVSTHSSEIIFVGTDDGNVWVDDDGDYDFRNISAGLPERWVTAIAHDPYSDTGVYVTLSGFRFGESAAQVYYSADLGESWSAIGSGLPDVPVNDIIVDDLLEGTLYVATDIGVFVSEDSGLNWELLGKDMPIVPILDLDLDQGSRLLAAASFGRGIYTYDLAQESAVTTTINETGFVLYPNPAQDYISVQSEIKLDDFSLYSATGQKIKSIPADVDKIFIGELEVGTYFISNGELSRTFVKN